MDVGEFGMRPLAGGFSGETFLAESAGERTVVRIYAQRGSSRGAAAVEVDAAMLRLVRGLLPVPEVLEVRRPDPAAGTPALLVTSFLPGERLDLLLPRLDEDARRTVAARLGVVLGRLAQMPVLRPGFFVDGDLRVEPMAGGDLVEFVRGHRASTALAAWDAAAYDGLLAVADRAQTLLDRVDRVTVVHSDFNPKNLLVDPDTLEVTGVLDWEFAHAGLPVTDLGNLLRFERDAAFAEGVVAAFRASVPDAGADVLDLARAADLYALVDLAGRRGSHEVADRAHNLLYAIACTGDLHAWG
ncbi:MAG: phosphotransferase family protein [Nocardioidaceae bacterium]